MRRLVPLLAAGLLAGCSGFSIAARQDKADATAFARVLADAGPGERLLAGDLLAKEWRRLWVFEDGVDTQLVEDRIGIPFPQSGEKPNAEGRGYLVFDDGEQVVSAFVPDARVEVRPSCLEADRRPLGRDARLVVVAAAGAPLLSTPTRAASCR